MSELIDPLADIESTDPLTLDDKEKSLEEVALLFCMDRANELQDQIQNESKELKQRQQSVRYLHKLLQEINNSTDEDGNLDLKGRDDLKEALDQAREMGVKIKEDKQSYTEREADKLIENIRMACDDLNVQNEMQIQKVSRLTNEMYECYQMTRSILKPLHEDKINKARSIAR